MSALPVAVDDFDPLVELAGMWTTDLAHHYLPIDGAPAARYEGFDGRLVMSPREGSANSYALLELGYLLRAESRRARCPVYGPLNLVFNYKTWIEPDLVVLRQPIQRQTWVPAELALMPIELVSPSSVRRDRIDKPVLMAKAGIPYYMRVEIADRRRAAEVHLLELRGVDYHPLAYAKQGERLESGLPFPISFDPADLLEP